MPKAPVIGISMSFMLLGSYHQYHIRNRYIDAVRASGALPLPIPCTTDTQSIRQYLDMADAMLFIGGSDYPPHLFGQEPHPKLNPMEDIRWQADLMLLPAAIAKGLPILGICAGHQLMAICHGGRLIQHLEQVATHTGENYHPVRITSGRWLARIFSEKELTVNSNHHQAIDPSDPGKGLSVVALAPDGVIEAVEADLPQMVLGLQWHPERITDPIHRQMVFSFLTDRAREYRSSHPA